MNTIGQMLKPKSEKHFRRLALELLEERQMLSAAPFFEATPPCTENQLLHYTSSDKWNVAWKNANGQLVRETDGVIVRENHSKSEDYAAGCHTGCSENSNSGSTSTDEWESSSSYEWEWEFSDTRIVEAVAGVVCTKKGVE